MPTVSDSFSPVCREVADQPLIHDHSLCSLCLFVCVCVYMCVNSQRYFELKLPFVDDNVYDSRLGLYCLGFFNDPIENGLVWFQRSSVHPEEVEVHFDQEFKAHLPEKYHAFDGAFIRRPDSISDQALPGYERLSADERAKRVQRWPPDIVFDLHRLVLARWGRLKWQGTIQAKRTAEAKKQQKRKSGEGQQQQGRGERKKRRGGQRSEKEDAEPQEEEEEIQGDKEKDTDT